MLRSDLNYAALFYFSKLGRMGDVKEEIYNLLLEEFRYFE